MREGCRLFDPRSSTDWEDDGTAERVEWVNRAYTSAPWEVQESLHPNYWGMLAERECLADALADEPRPRVVCAPVS